MVFNVHKNTAPRKEGQTMKWKKEYLVSSILFALDAVIWIITIPLTYSHRRIFDILLSLHCCCALLFSAAAIAFFIKYRRSNRNKDDKNI